MNTYHWEIQRFDSDLGWWRFTDNDPRGADESVMSPATFAHSLLLRYDLLDDGHRRSVVWTDAGVGRAPAATHIGGAP